MAGSYPDGERTGIPDQLVKPLHFPLIGSVTLIWLNAAALGLLQDLIDVAG
jgi:hypothetical protein